MKKIEIIGGADFIGSHIIKRFLAKNFKVKVSTTNLSKKEKHHYLLTLKNAELDFQNLDALANFIKDLEIVIHCKTPFHLDVKDPKTELFDPTVKGTETFLKVTTSSKTLEKLVFVTSVAAYNTYFPKSANSQTANHIYTEKDTPLLNETNHPYAKVTKPHIFINAR